MNARIIVLSLLSSLAGGLVVFAVMTNFSEPRGRPQRIAETRVVVDSTPVSRDPAMSASFSQVISNVAPSVVNIYSTKVIGPSPALPPLLRDPLFRRFFGDSSDPEPQQEQGLGSGVIVTRDGYILTNNHVVDGAEEIRVILHDGAEFAAVVVGTDPPTDLAVLKIDAMDVPAVIMADSSNVHVGDVALAIGNPFGVGQTVTMGIISATGRGFGLIDYEDFIQTDASINPGNSGGALADAEGRLIGINTAILSRSGGFQGIGFAVPVNLAKFTMQQILTQGRVIRGYLGVFVQPITPQLAKAFNVPREGALVGGVSDRSPAAKAGLEPGDIIRAVDDEPINDNRELRLRIAQTPPGTTVDLQIMRGDSKLTVPVTLGELPSDELAAATPPRLGAEPEDSREPLLDGVELTDIVPRIRRELRIPREVTGALALGVDPTSVAHDAGLRPGDVILEVNRQPIQNSKELTRTIRRLGGADSILLRVWSGGATKYIVLQRSGDVRPQIGIRRN